MGSDNRTHAERAAMGATAGDRGRAGQSDERAQEIVSDRRPAIRTWRDTYNLLALAAAFDGRERGEYEARAWLKVLDGFPIEDTEQAITEHYRSSRYPVMPADVLQIIEEGPRS